METYNPIPKSELKLNPTTRANERKLNEIIVRWPGSDLNEKIALCRAEGWEPEKKIPEMAQQPRISIDALKQMVKRLEGKPSMLEKEMKELIKRFHKPTAIEPLKADEYWMEMCKVLFEGFPENTDPEEINMSEVRRAYEDFHGG